MELPKNVNIYLCNYQVETAIFLVTKHEKTTMACSYLNFSIQKIDQNSKKMVALWGIAHWEWLWGCFSCYEYGANAFEAVQNISTRTLLSYANSLKQFILNYTYDKTYLAVYYLLIGDANQVSVFSQTNKNE